MTSHQGPTKKRRAPSKETMRAIRAAFDPEALARICVQHDFSDYAPRFDLPATRSSSDRFYHYVDNGSPILGVAHLDSVQEDGRCTVVDTAAGLMAVSGTLDDRLGAFVILDLLPKLGITVDWLLTTDEESGASTAEDFRTDKAYNWMFQFDRGGTDVVMYQYETDDLVARVEDSGARVGAGSFSDICCLDRLEVAGFNWGVGYRDYHSARSHAWLEDTFRMVARFDRFYHANRDKHLPFESLGWDDDLIDIDDEDFADQGRLREWFSERQESLGQNAS